VSLYLIQRGPRPAYHKAPFHPVIICDRKRIGEWESQDTDNKCNVWVNSTGPHSGWLMWRWQGLIIDYGHVVHKIVLPDGTEADFYRDYDDPHTIKHLLPGAIWWSDKVMPKWIEALGVVYPLDKFTQGCILDAVADDGCMGATRPLPTHWKRRE